METLTVDGSTLPALKDLFPEHFFEHPEQAMNQTQPGAMHIPPHMTGSVPQVPHHQQQQNIDAQHQELQYGYSGGLPNGAYAQQFQPTHGDDRGGRQGTKRAYDAVHAPSHPQSQPHDPYSLSMGPSGPLHPFPASSDVHLRLPGPESVHDGMGDDEGDDDDDAPEDGEKRRHPCPHCGRRFNRPSSLKIHLNTHTGAKPYACPFEGCGRTFNVSSNMRRHFRNHARRPPPPPLPQNNIYPMSTDFPSQQQEQRVRGRPSQPNPNTMQSLPLVVPHDNGARYGDPSDYASQYYPPSSDVRNSGNGRDQKQMVTGALITPPYTNEGDEQDQDIQNHRSFYPQMGPYNGYGPGAGQSGPNPIYVGSQIGMQPGMAGMQLTMGMPTPGMPPVDPALGGHNGNHVPDADGEADADGEVDPDLNTDLGAYPRREFESAGGGELRRFGMSTSNARASSDPRTDIGSIRQRGSMAGANGFASVSAPVPMGNGNDVSLLSASAPRGMQQMLLTSPVDQVHTSAQAPQYVHQYGAHYPQQQFQYQQQQQQMFDPNGMNGMRGGGPPNGSSYLQAPYANGAYLSQHQQATQYAPHMGQGGVKAVAGWSDDRNRNARQRGAMDSRTHPQSNARATRNAGAPAGSSNVASGIVDSNGTGISWNMTPGAAPAPPYKVYSYPPPAVPDAERDGQNLSNSAPPEQLQDPDAAGGEDEESDEDVSEEVEEDDDDDDYTGRPTPKRGKAAKRGGTARGRPRGRPKGNANTTGRGRGRPRKSAPDVAADDEEPERNEGATDKAQNNTESSEGLVVGGRVLRKRRRVSAR